MSFCFRIVHRTRFDLNRHSTSPPVHIGRRHRVTARQAGTCRHGSTRRACVRPMPCPAGGRESADHANRTASRTRSRGIPATCIGRASRTRVATLLRLVAHRIPQPCPLVDARTSCTRRRRDSSAPRGLGHARIAIAAPPARSVDARACTRGGRARERTAHVALPVMRGTLVRPRRMPGFGTRRRGSGRSSQRRVHVRRDSLLSLSDARRRRRRALLHVGQHLPARQ